MKALVLIEMTSDEIEKKIPYKCLVESWDRFKTFSGKRAMAQANVTLDQMRPYLRRARIWYLHRGAPQRCRMSPASLAMWDKIGKAISLLP